MLKLGQRFRIFQGQTFYIKLNTNLFHEDPASEGDCLADGGDDEAVVEGDVLEPRFDPAGHGGGRQAVLVVPQGGQAGAQGGQA